MAVGQIDTLVAGGGQAGLAMSEHLGKCGVPHLVLGRWDSLVANGYGLANMQPLCSLFPDGKPLYFAPLTGGIRPLTIGLVMPAGERRTRTVAAFVDQSGGFIGEQQVVGLARKAPWTIAALRAAPGRGTRAALPTWIRSGEAARSRHIHRACGPASLNRGHKQPSARQGRGRTTHPRYRRQP